MESADGRYVIVFNGEIYNHLELRASLRSEGCAPSWRGNSDTESLVEAIAAWGVERSLVSCVGMFAFAVFDRHERTLTLARDRLGEKPLYWGYRDGALVFGSELKVLTAVRPGGALHLGAVAAYLRLGYVPGRQSIESGVYRVPPATLMVFNVGDVARQAYPKEHVYWDVAALSQLAPGASRTSPGTSLEQFEVTLARAVKQQMLSDVPLGALLSGGIDSSLIVALMQAQSHRPVRTFSIGFEGQDVDEAPFARSVAEHLGCEHTEMYFSVREALDLVPRLPRVWCEPFADSSQLPTLLVASLARRHVTVALTGDGGDELFAGYERYFRVVKFARYLARIPGLVRRAGAAFLQRTPVSLLDALVRALGNPGGARFPGDRLLKAAALARYTDVSALNRELVTLWHPIGSEIPSVYVGPLPKANTDIERMMLADTVAYLPDDLLVKVDRASMAYSLECRAPFLDHRVVECAWSLHPGERAIQLPGKLALRSLLARHLPIRLFERPKQGFGLPVTGWLQGPLREWAESLLSEASLRDSGVFNVKLVRQRWREHIAGHRNWQQHLWAVLMLQSWLETRR
jgi:asparagine synthase (glutamine-hydrolysing)